MAYLWWIYVGKHQEHLRQIRIGNPHLRTVDHVMISVLFSCCFQSKRVWSRCWFGQRKTTGRFLGEDGQVLFLLFLGGQFQHQIVHQSVVNVDVSTDRSINLWQFFHNQHGSHEVTFAAAVLGGCFDAHQPVVEKRLYHVWVKLVRLVHFRNKRSNLLFGQLANCNQIIKCH